MRPSILIFTTLLVFSAGIVQSQLTKDKTTSILDYINQLGSATDERIEEIQQQLLEMGDEALPYLIRALESNPDAKVRYQVALILGNSRSPEAVKPLFIALQLDRSKSAREGAELAFANLIAELDERRMEDTTYRDYSRVGRGTIVTLKKTLKSDPDADKRANAAKSVGRLGKKSDIDDILKMIPDERIPEVRIEMIKAVEQLAYPEMLQGNYRIVYFNTVSPVLGRFRIRLTDQYLNIIENDAEWEVRETAVRSLTRLVYPIFVLGENRLSRLKGFRDEQAYIIERVIEKFLDYAVTAEYRKLRASLIESVTSLLTSYFRKDETGLDDEIRRRLTTEIYNFHGDYAYYRLPYTVRVRYEKRFTYTPLKKSSLADKARKIFAYILLNDPEAKNRLLAARAFKTLGRRADTNDIIRALNTEKDTEVWLECIEAVGKIGDFSSSKWLYSIAVNKNASVPLRERAIYAIAIINNPEITRALADHYVNENDGAIKLAILDAMRFRKDNKTATFLLKILDDPDPEYRRAAVGSLCENTYKPAIPKLKDLLKNDANATARAAVIPCLANNDPGNATKEIIDALSDKSPIVRRAAAVELGIMKERKGAVRLAEIMRNDTDNDVRLESTRSLGYVGDQYSVQPLIEAIIYDNSEAVWAEALRSLIMLERPRMGIVAIMNMMIEAQKKYPDAISRLQEAEYYLRLQWEGYSRRY